MPLADCIGVPSPCAPSTSEKGFIAKGTSAMCDFPSEPLYTRNTFGICVRPGVAGRFLLDPDRVSPELAVRGLLDAEVAVLHEAAQAGLVDSVLGQARAEQLLRLAHGRSLLGSGGARCRPSRGWGPAGRGALTNSNRARRTRTWCRPSWR